MQAKKSEAHMSNEERLAVLEVTILNINAALLDIKQDIRRQSDKMDSRFDAVDRKIKNLEHDIDKKFEFIHNRLWTIFLWMISMMVGLAGLIAHTQHWI